MHAITGGLIEWPNAFRHSIGRQHDVQRDAEHIGFIVLQSTNQKERAVVSIGVGLTQSSDIGQTSLSQRSE